MMSLFTSFDIFVNKIPFLCFYFVSFFVFFKFWANTTLHVVFHSAYALMAAFFKSVTSFKFKTLDLFLVVLMAFIFLLSFFSILPFNFPLTSQISVNLYWGLSLWVSLFIFSIMMNIKHVLIHLIPEGTPFFLIWFLFFVELVSNIIRPLTLVVRLLANILAGHLLMILLSKMVFLLFPFVGFFLVLNLVEFFVSIVQSYIFVTMLILYISEMY